MSLRFLGITSRPFLYSQCWVIRVFPLLRVSCLVDGAFTLTTSSISVNGKELSFYATTNRNGFVCLLPTNATADAFSLPSLIINHGFCEQFAKGMERRFLYSPFPVAIHDSLYVMGYYVQNGTYVVSPVLQPSIETYGSLLSLPFIVGSHIARSPQKSMSLLSSSLSPFSSL